MKASELKKRRLDAYMTQYDLAQKIGVTVDTIRRWERLGERELPFAANRKISLAKVGPREPDVVAPMYAKLRPDLALFEPPFRGTYFRGTEHPKRLLPHLDKDHQHLPWSILESPEYLEALAKHRAKPAAPAAVLSPEQQNAQSLYEKFMSEQDDT